jgi:hypothetical protein
MSGDSVDTENQANVDVEFQPQTGRRSLVVTSLTNRMGHVRLSRTRCTQHVLMIQISTNERHMRPVQVRDAVAAGTVRPTDSVVPQVAGRFDALIQYVCLRLGRRLGTEVTPALTRRDLSDPASRTQALIAQLTATGMLTGGIKILVSSALFLSQPTCGPGRSSGPDPL